MEEATRKRKPEKESSPAEDGSPLALELARQQISGEEDGGCGGGGEGAEKRNWESLQVFLDYKDDEDEEEARGEEDEEDETRVAPARRQRHVEVRRDCPYLDTVNRQGKKVDTSQRTIDLPRQWETEAANAIRDIAALKKEIEQTVKTSNVLLDQLESYVGEDIIFVNSMFDVQWEGIQKYGKLFSEIKKGHHAALNGLNQMTGIIEKMPHALIDKEPVNPSLPDDAEGKKVDTSQRTNDLPRQWETEAANAIRDIAALKKEIEQTVKTSNELLDQLESYVGEDIICVNSMFDVQWEGIQKYGKLFSEIKKSHHAALNGLNQMIGIIEKMPHALIDKEPVNPSLPDDAEGKKVDTSQRTIDLPRQWETEAANAIRDIAGWWFILLSY